MNTNQKPFWIRKVRTALLGAIAGVSTLSGASECSAHFFHRGWCWGSGWHGVSYYSSFPTYSSFYSPFHHIHHYRTAVHYRPLVHYYRPMVIRPSYVNPWCYAPIQYYAPPVYRAPICYPPVNSIQVGYGTQLGYAPPMHDGLTMGDRALARASWNKPSIAGERIYSSPSSRMAVANWLDDRDDYANEELTKSELQSVRLPFRLVSTQMELSEERTSSRSVTVSKPAIKPLTPTSLAWSDSASGLLDEMVLAGEMGNALRSCDAMASNRQPMSKGIYLRHAILKLFTPDTETDLEKVLELLNMSAAAGCEINPAELGVPTLREYLEPSRVGLQESLNQLSQNALQSKTDGAADLLLIATLLKLDGQSERSRLFASEAFEKAAASESFAWHSLLAAVSK